MLSKEEADARLEAASSAKDGGRQEVRARGLAAPRLASRIAAAVRDRVKTPASETMAIAAELDGLSERKRTVVFRALCPSLGTELSHWWAWSVAMPYRRGYDRRAFRSANPVHSRAGRWSVLASLLQFGTDYPHPIEWAATWAAYLSEYLPLGELFASAIDAGNDEVRRILVESATVSHAVGGPSKQGYVALLACASPQAWSVVVQQLVGAERAEGLRQTILEAADLGHPDAFAQVLDVVREKNLIRFASAVRAVGIWFGEALGVEKAAQAATAVEKAATYLRRPPTLDELREADPRDVFLGLWAIAVHGIGTAIAAATALIHDPDEGRRLAAARMLVAVAVAENTEPLLAALSDESLPVLATALMRWPQDDGHPVVGVGLLPDHAYAVLRRRMDELGTSVTVDVHLLGENLRKIGAKEIALVLLAYGGARVDPAVLAFETSRGKWLRVRRLAEDPERHRAELFALLLDVSESVRGLAGGGLRDIASITADEALLLEKGLTRKASDLRQTHLKLLQRQGRPAVEASIARLDAGAPAQRQAADELRELVGAASAEEEPVLPEVLRYRPEDRTPAVRLSRVQRDWTTYQAGAARIMTSLSAWLAEHADVEVQTPFGVRLLANLSPRIISLEGLDALIDPWWERTRPGLVDGGVELALLALILADDSDVGRQQGRLILHDLPEPLSDGQAASLGPQLITLLARREWRASWTEPVLDLLDTAAAALPVADLIGPRNAVLDKDAKLIRADPRGASGGIFVAASRLLDPATLSDEQLGRLWRTLRFVDEPAGAFDRWRGPQYEMPVGDAFQVMPDQPFRLRADSSILVEAFERGLATRADLIDQLFPMSWTVRGRAGEISWPRFGHLGDPRHARVEELTALRPPEWAARPATQAVIEEVRRMLIEQELQRGDLPTAFTGLVSRMRSVSGAQSLCTVLAVLGRTPLGRTDVDGRSRPGMLSQLVRIHHPAPEDTAETLTSAIAAARLPEKRIVETALYAPQWAGLIEQHLGWPGLESMVWWLYAHTEDDLYRENPDAQAVRLRQIGQRTPLDHADFERGSVDAGWFHQAYEALGDERLDRLLAVVKLTSARAGHKRSELFANALRGRGAAEIVERARTKRHQDSVRAVGLLPLGDDPGALQERYEMLRGFVAGDRSSGAMRRASETEAVQIGLENLARTAGYRDPQRLIWAMEAKAAADLADGPVTATDGDLVVSLTIDDLGMPVTEVARAGRRLASVPVKSRKHPGIAALTERAKELTKQAQRMRASLEAACVLGDAFEPAELVELRSHPMLARMLSTVVMVDAEGRAGFLGADPSRLVAADGAEFAAIGRLTIAHPVDLLASGDWPDLQHAVMAGGRPQPFTQVFRELYVLNDNERGERGADSRRYAGHQLSARRAYGLLTSRGWVSDFSIGFFRTFHQEKITAWCELLQGWGTAADVESATVQDVSFYDLGTRCSLPLAEVPRRLFSEVMRDLDLVVSVAHVGGVDPETSESTIEVRRRIVDETCDLLGLRNVEVDGHHARIKGEIGSYSVHLGSGIVHRLPGNALFLIPVGGQQRGRIFLPFVDDDPRTAEIVSKVVLLAQDDRITDPTVVGQIVR